MFPTKRQNSFLNQKEFAWLADEGKNQFWRVVFVCVSVVFTLAISLLPLSYLLQSSERVQQRGFDPSTFTPSELGLSTPLFLGVALLPFTVALLVLLISGNRLHRRSVLTFISAEGVFRGLRFCKGFIVWMIPLLIAELVRYAYYPEIYTFTFSLYPFLTSLLVLMLFLPGQIAFEEVAIRGYLLQQLTYVFKRPWLSALLSALLFGLLHIDNPEVAKYGFLNSMPYYLFIGFFLAVLAIVDNGLELPLGIHLATNFYVTVFVNQTGSALPSSPVFIVELSSTTALLILFVVQVVFFYAAFAKTSNWDIKRLKKPLP